MNRLTLSILAALLVTPALAGPTSPPGGPITSTMKTLAEIEPRIAINATNTPGDATSMFRITAPGSYYLPAPIMGVSGKSGIVIAVNNVTIDLCGQSVLGSITSLDGVAVTGVRSAIVVRNGTVSGWGGYGVTLGIGGRNGLVETIAATGNGAWGISGNKDAVVRNSTASQNGQGGIGSAEGGLVESCTSDLNTGVGIAIGKGGTIRNSTFSNNTIYGVNGSYGCTVTGCSAWGNTRGVAVYVGSVVSNCQISGCAFDAIVGDDQCTIRDNTLTSNGPAPNGIGIRVNGSGSRIEGNHCAGNGQFGIWVPGDHNVIVRNTCSGNTTNWSIGANNFFGPIIDRTAAAAGAVSGNAAASTLGSTDPNANFSY